MVAPFRRVRGRCRLRNSHIVRHVADDYKTGGEIIGKEVDGVNVAVKEATDAAFVDCLLCGCRQSLESLRTRLERHAHAQNMNETNGNTTENQVCGFKIAKVL